MFILVTRQKVNRHRSLRGPRPGRREAGARRREEAASGSSECLLLAGHLHARPLSASLMLAGVATTDHRFALLFSLRGQRGDDVPGRERGEV